MRRTTVASHAIALVVFASLFCSCATITSGSHEVITVTSEPREAIATLECETAKYPGKPTPAEILIRRKVGSCMLTVSKPGYANEFVWIEQGVNPAYWLNFWNAAAAPLGMAAAHDGEGILFAGVGVFITSGWLADFWSGANHWHRPNKVHVVLTKSGTQEKPRPDAPVGRRE